MVTLKELVELAGEWARRVLVERGSPLMPTWVLINEKGETSVLGTPWRNEEEKKLGKLVMQQYVRENKIIAYSFVTEAWMAKKPKGWRPGGPDDVRPVKDPNRREIVLAIATDGKGQEFRTWAIRRDYHERISALELQKGDSAFAGNISGWMTELLVDK